MQAFFIRSSAFAVMCALAACGGGGGDGGGSGGGEPPVRNGLPYGAEGQALSDAEGVAITAQKASFQAGSVSAIDRGTITLDAGFVAALSDAARSGTVEIFGQTVTITNGVGDLVTGEEVRITFDTSPGRIGTYAGILDINVSGPDAGDINGEGTYVFGFETDPAQVDARTGSLLYSGEFLAQGSLANSVDTSTEYQGAIDVAVNFAGIGSANVTLNGTVAAADPATLTGTLGLSGNGFAGGLGCTAGCPAAGGSTIDATFYGPDAIELGGVIAVDITVNGKTYDGVGSFILTDPAIR